jgi:hypothetical protein
MNHKNVFGIILVVCCLSGCGVSQVVRDEYEKPVAIVESAYTYRGCIKKLKNKANDLGVKSNNAVVDKSKIKILMWPFVKAVTCKSYLE